MNIAIILGNRINDDGTLTDLMIKRLYLGMELYQRQEIDYIIVSGGQANTAVDSTEAFAMKKYLVERGIPEEVIIMEDKSLSTSENAKFSVPIAKELGATTIIVCSSSEHFTKYSYNVIKYFEKEIAPSPIRLMIYTDCEGDSYE